MVPHLGIPQHKPSVGDRCTRGLRGGEGGHCVLCQAHPLGCRWSYHLALKHWCMWSPWWGQLPSMCLSPAWENAC